MPKPDKTLEYLEKLKQYFYKHGILPNFDTVKDLLALKSKGSVTKFFNKLLEKGLLTKDWNKYFPTEKFLSIPMFESVKAWFPSPASDDMRYDLNIHNFLVKNPNSTILLRVKGDSMIWEWIWEWDIVVVDKSLKYKVWDIVIAIVDWEFTMKFLMKDAWWKAYLKAANNNYDDIYPREQLEIFWVVVWAFRKYRD